jgi:hypothetical protein
MGGSRGIERATRVLEPDLCIPDLAALVAPGNEASSAGPPRRACGSARRSVSKARHPLGHFTRSGALVDRGCVGPLDCLSKACLAVGDFARARSDALRFSRNGSAGSFLNSGNGDSFSALELIEAGQTQLATKWPQKIGIRSGASTRG